MPGPNVRYWELKGDPEGRRFCFTITPQMTCPLASIDPDRPSGDVGSPWPKGVDEAAACLECAPVDLARILERAHRSAAGGRRRDSQGRLTKDCNVCGARMDDHGYSAYVERDARSGDERFDSAERAVADRLGMQPPAVRLKGMNGMRRGEARKWAWEQYTIAKAALQEKAR